MTSLIEAILMDKRRLEREVERLKAEIARLEAKIVELRAELELVSK